jgi:hypothetical protein
MRTYIICLALAIVLICPFASGQLVQTNGLNEGRVLHHPLMGANVSRETPRGLLGLLTQHRMQAEFIRRLDSLRASGLQSQFPDARFIPNRIQRSSRPLRKISSPQSQIYVIDTAIVWSTQDTMRHLYSFDGGGRTTSDLSKKLKGDFWVDTLCRSLAYDSIGNMLFDLSEVWSNGQWVNDSRYTWIYDGQGNMLSESQEDWDSGQWVSTWRYTYTYDASNNTLSWLWDHWNNGQWEHQMRFTYTYDANGNRLSELAELGASGQWVIWARTTWTYDANGIRLSELAESWQGSQWVNIGRYTYTYDAGNHMLSSLYEDWSGSQWLNSSRWTYSYGANGDMLSEVVERWSDGHWMNFERYTYTYDAAGNLISISHGGWSGSSWTAADIAGSISVTDSAGNSYEYYHCYNITLIYKVVLTGLSSESDNLTATYSLSQNYPNPFNPRTKIQFTIVSAQIGSASGGNRQLTIVKVYDVLGRDVATLVNEVKQPGTYTVEFNGSNLTSGVYVYRLTAGDFVQSRKLMIVK